MTKLVLDLDNDLAHEVEESARQEHKPVSVWAAERLRLAAIEVKAIGNGYPPGWSKLFGSIAEEDGFEAPARSAQR